MCARPRGAAALPARDALPSRTPMGAPFEIDESARRAAASPPSRAIVFTAPALLVLTALLQLALTHAGPLSPAKGGGFGLFSTVDKLENRILLASLETPDGDLAIAVVGLDDEILDVASFPSQRNLERFARRIMLARTPPPNAKALRLEVWKRTFDPTTGVHGRVLVAKRSVPFAS